MTAIPLLAAFALADDAAVRIATHAPDAASVDVPVVFGMAPVDGSVGAGKRPVRYRIAESDQQVCVDLSRPGSRKLVPVMCSSLAGPSAAAGISEHRFATVFVTELRDAQGQWVFDPRTMALPPASSDKVGVDCAQGSRAIACALPLQPCAWCDDAGTPQADCQPPDATCPP